MTETFILTVFSLHIWFMYNVQTNELARMGIVRDSILISVRVLRRQLKEFKLTVYQFIVCLCDINHYRRGQMCDVRAPAIVGIQTTANN